MTVRIITGDCRRVMPAEGPFDMILADPPYGDTSLDWDKLVAGWEVAARENLKPTGSLWVFGSMRFFLKMGPVFEAAGLHMAQDVVWEKHNGSNMHNDRFRRVHEHAVQFYRADVEWEAVYNEVQTTADETPRTVRRKKRPPHNGGDAESVYVSEDGGPKLMRSVIYMRSMHGRAIHRTQKPDALLEILVRTSCPPGGLVGDFFAGSGAGGKACQMAGRNYVGAELDPLMADKARAWLGSDLFGRAA
ncbi:DNA-methyltransferase [Azospirillum sp.]|uniref:DNA-methyltransferase n=1 Tax=Azospirillum sp. TaxID=34012 RepID=UPI003D73E3F2